MTGYAYWIKEEEREGNTEWGREGGKEKEEQKEGRKTGRKGGGKREKEELDLLNISIVIAAVWSGDNP